MSLGENRLIATALSYMRNHNTVTAAELEHETGLRQPEVSIVMYVLIERGLIISKQEIRTGRGRRNNIYSLSVSMDDIIQEYENREVEKAKEQMGKIEKLKNLK